jgi:hypothetical protein
MNLHALVAPMVAAINPMVTVQLRTSSGSTTGDDGSRIPAYADPIDVSAQIQSLQYQDILKLAGLNLQGVRNKIYMSGNWQGIVRADRKGGDLLTMPNGDVYLVALVLESWPDWTCVAVTEQLRP